MLSLPTSRSPVLPVLSPSCFPPQSDFPTAPVSHYLLALPCSMCLSARLVYFVFKPVLLLYTLSSSSCQSCLVHLSPVLLCPFSRSLCVPCVPDLFLVVFWFVLTFRITLVFSSARLLSSVFCHLPFYCSQIWWYKCELWHLLSTYWWTTDFILYTIFYFWRGKIFLLQSYCQISQSL